MKGAGARPHRVQFQRYTATTDDYGGEVETWADYGPAMFARVVHGSGQERREAAQEQAAISAVFYVLANSQTKALTPGDRITWNGLWDIQSVVPSLAFGREIEVTAIRAAD